MDKRTILEWEDYTEFGGNTCSDAHNGRRWAAYVGGMKDNPTYNLTMGDTFGIMQGLPTLEAAKKMAQDLQDILDGYAIAMHVTFPEATDAQSGACKNCKEELNICAWRENGDCCNHCDH